MRASTVMHARALDAPSSRSRAERGQDAILQGVLYGARGTSCLEAGSLPLAREPRPIRQRPIELSRTLAVLLRPPCVKATSQHLLGGTRSSGWLWRYAASCSRPARMIPGQWEALLLPPPGGGAAAVLLPPAAACLCRRPPPRGKSERAPLCRGRSVENHCSVH